MKLSDLYEAMTEVIDQTCDAGSWDVVVEVSDHDVISKDFEHKLLTIQTKNICFWCGYLICLCEDVPTKPTLKVVK